MKVLNIGVLGGGSFGTALGSMAARCGHNVLIHSRTKESVDEINNLRTHTRFFPKEIILPQNLKATLDIDEVLSKPDMLIHAVPVQSTYEFIKGISDKIPDNVPYIISSKGILLKQKKFISEVWDELFPSKKVHHCVLSGPSFAIEMMREYPTCVSLGCKDELIAKFVQENLSSENFRIYSTNDVKGVEIGGALKNPLAIGSGLVEGIGMKFNTATALVTRGIYEISLFSAKFGGKSETLYGLSGIGDVMLTCLGNLSRNKSVGIKLAQGMTIEEIIEKSTEVAEGIPTLMVLGEMIKEHNLNMPVMCTLHQVVKGEISVKEAQHQLMLRQLENELELKI